MAALHTKNIFVTKVCKRGGICLTVLIFLIFWVYMINGYVVSSGSRYIISPAKVPRTDAIVVLGAYVFPDGSPSYMLSHRLRAGYELYQNNRAAKIIVSGDHGRQDYDEVNAMKGFLVAKGIPSQNIFMDHAGFTTYDSIYRAKEIFQVNKIVIVTQEFHLPRALYMARAMGIEAYGIVAEKQGYSDTVMLSNNIREIVARCKAFFMVELFKPKPTFLGDPIPITGDGRTTDDKKR